ncbi:hypothetical protein [Burkholderia sp. BDU5]|uniref:hypothetical protein n=1 Tax=Burkholderia sp. BDU5 TaxID=1385590 RepID=UPI00075F0974|nr:hypothetical protein [Burkholderia sp. BDU5]KVE35697.1 hypothetical protein WS69_13680 [Burkholderia sp. BDU5]
MALDIKKLAAKAKKTGRDFTKTTSGGGGEYTPPAAGPCNLRFVGYFEIGLQKKTFKGAEKKVKQVQLVFELSGKNYPPKELDDGTKLPVRMTITEADSTNVKATINKIFNKLNYEGKATHFAELLGNAYRGRVYHVEKETDGGKVVYANLRNEDGYSFTPPVIEVIDEETGDVTTKPVKVAEPLTELKLFLWDNPDKEQWDSIYIDGEYEAVKDEKTGKIVKPARSKNVLQNKIRAALNWEGSPMQLLLEDGELETDDTEGNEADPDEQEHDESDDDTPPPSKGTATAKKAAAAKATASKKTTTKKAPPKKKPEPEPEPDDDDAGGDDAGDDDDPLEDI